MKRTSTRRTRRTKIVILHSAIASPKVVAGALGGGALGGVGGDGGGARGGVDGDVTAGGLHNPHSADASYAISWHAWVSECVDDAMSLGKQAARG